MLKSLKEGYLAVGTITTTHGLRGEVKVYPALDDPGRFSLFREIRLEKEGKPPVEMEIEKVRYFKNRPIVKFKGIDDIDEVMKYRGYEILVLRELAADLKENQFFDIDLLGLAVITEEGEELGTVKEVLHTGANEVLSVTMKNGKELLLPVIHDCIREVDLSAGVIRIHLMPGLL